MPDRYRRAWLWLKLYSRFPELLFSQLGRDSGFTESRIMITRSGMDGVLLPLPIFFVVWLLFGQHIASWAYFISAGLLFTYGTFFSPSRDALSESKKLRAEGVWFPEWLVASKIISLLLMFFGAALQIVITFSVVGAIVLITK